MPQVDIKVVLLGDTAVGKTCLSERISNDKFPNHTTIQNVSKVTHTNAYKGAVPMHLVKLRRTWGARLKRPKPEVTSAYAQFREKHGNCAFVQVLNSLMCKTIGTAFVSKEIKVDDKNLVLGIWDTAGFERYDSMVKLYYRGAQAAIICYDVTNPKTFTKAKYWVREVRSVEEGCKIYICATKKDLLDQGAQASPDLELVENYAAGVQSRFFITSSKTGENRINGDSSLRAAELFQDIASYYAPTIVKENSQTWGNNGFISLTTNTKKSTCCPLGRR